MATLVHNSGNDYTLVPDEEGASIWITIGNIVACVYSRNEKNENDPAVFVSLHPIGHEDDENNRIDVCIAYQRDAFRNTQ